MKGMRLTIYLPDLSGGGAERLHVGLARHWRDAGAEVTFLLDRRGGELIDSVPAGCLIEVLGARRQIAALPRLVRHLRRSPPDVLLVNMEHMNVMAVAARALARARTSVVVTQHNALSEQVKRPSWKWRALPALYRRALPRADAVVAVSAGVADDMAQLAGFPRERVEVIHNGLVSDDFGARIAVPSAHPWLSEGRPVIAAMGRLVPQKDFATLIEAMAAISERTDARLVILGEGPLRGELEALRDALGLRDRVDLAGFAADPLPTLARASLFVLSSRFEGFGNVLVEALACGTPVVSTDCPHGPSEILAGGAFGRLVPVGDPHALGNAILMSLEAPTDPDRLRARAADFTSRACAERYAGLFERLRPSFRTDMHDARP